MISRDVLAGAIFVVLGAGFATEARNYELGTAFRMGPGYMPLVLGIALAVLGLIVVIQALRKPGVDDPRPIPWRGIALIVVALIFFGSTIRWMGLVPVAFLTALVTAFASRESTIGFSLVVAVVLTVLSVAIFHYGLGLSVPLFGAWAGPLAALR